MFYFRFSTTESIKPNFFASSAVIKLSRSKASDIQIHAKEILSLKERLNKIYSKHTGKTVDEISDALERDNFMTAEEAKKFGLIDSVVEKRK